MRIRRTKIIINNLRSLKHNPSMIKINVKLVTLTLFVVMIIIQNIVHDVLRLLSSCKGPRHLLHPSFCHNRFLLSSRTNWSFMTNLLPLPHLMYLCVLVTPIRMKLQSLLEPNIIILLNRKGRKNTYLMETAREIIHGVL